MLSFSFWIKSVFFLVNKIICPSNLLIFLYNSSKPKQKPSIPQPKPTDNTNKTENKNNEEKKPDFTRKR